MILTGENRSTQEREPLPVPRFSPQTAHEFFASL
jgi:hypothetical protein